MIQKVTHVFHIIMASIVIATAMLCIYWYFIDGEIVNVPIEFENTLLQTTKDVYERGDQVEVLWKFCKNTNESAELKGNLVNGFTHYMPTIVGVRPPGCYDGLDAIGYIPPNIPKEHANDDFHIVLEGTYRINPIKTKTYRFTTNEFKILDKIK